MKECSKCCTFKERSEFYKNKHTMDGLQPVCKECNKASVAAKTRLKKTKCTAKKYDALYNKQKGCCAICGKHASEFERSLAADHCHNTKKVRGLLCTTCNMGLGYFKDNPELLMKAALYLQEP